jgi:hypothetical protein
MHASKVSGSGKKGEREGSWVSYGGCQVMVEVQVGSVSWFLLARGSKREMAQEYHAWPSSTPRQATKDNTNVHRARSVRFIVVLVMVDSLGGF